MDAPWALFDGAAPEVMALTLGFNTGPKGTMNVTLMPGEMKTVYVGNAFSSYDNPRLSLGFYTAEFTDDGVVFKRTKSWAFIPLDHRFRAIKEQCALIFSDDNQ